MRGATNINCQYETPVPQIRAKVYKSGDMPLAHTIENKAGVLSPPTSKDGNLHSMDLWRMASSI